MAYNKSNKIKEQIIDNPITPRKKVTWLNINNPSGKEIEFLRKKYKFNFEHLKASLGKSISQRADVSMGEDYIFLILHFPQFNGGKNIIAGEIDFFIGKNYLITMHNNVSSLNHFFDLCKKNNQDLLSYKIESSAILLYEILQQQINEIYALLDKNSIDSSTAEDSIFDYKQKKATSEILTIRRNIINIRKIMLNHKEILKQLLNFETSILPTKELNDHYDDLIEHTSRIWDILNNQREMIEALHDTNDSLMNYQISDIMKTLTIFSVIVFPLTLFAAIFGMNTLGGMPFVDNPNGFWIIFSFMFVCCLGMLFFFKKKRWL